ncbi:hypothetical protein LUW75_09285 [Streptomyces sp. MRC013]|uniref:hypothetical protein n=1 Tax=Streptomyces sp. MRC013 TaxID=2898276 RepID=UPI0020274056|nr:hypothetical protein [Streptomyces sp. MRC013]URM90148.1 hypothetical protein LUW75_09285 [Streptomyces sp. MRC013]
MAASHWLGDPPADRERLAAWALSRVAATAAEDVHVDAVVDIVHAARDARTDLGGRFGGCEVGEPDAGQAEERRRFRLDGISPRRLREEDCDEPWAALFDPARLVRGIATVRNVRRGREWVELVLTPHAAFAAPADAWLPPGACDLVVRVDTATGFLLSATVVDEQGPLVTGRISGLAIRDTSPSPADAGRVLARMARTLVEPARLTADVRIETDTHTDLSTTPVPSVRSWTVSCGTETLTVTGDYAPDRTSPAAARLAELLAPARIVSHLAHVEATSPASITATVRPLRSFPLSAWAPDESLTCRFTVDRTTGVLLYAEATEGDHTLFRHVVTSLGP